MKKVKQGVETQHLILIVLIVIASLFIAQRILQKLPHSSSPETSGTSTPMAEVTPDPFTGVPKTLRGTVTCLPHKNQEGPQTMECAYGLKDSTGKYYGLRDQDPGMKHLSKIEMNKEVTLKGLFKAEDNTIYPTVGIFEIESIEGQ